MGYVSHAMSHTPWLQKRDIDNPDQRISDSAEQQLACRKTGLVHCIVTLSAKLCHSKCYLRFSNMMYILFSGFLSAVLLI